MLRTSGGRTLRNLPYSLLYTQFVKENKGTRKSVLLLQICTPTFILFSILLKQDVVQLMRHSRQDIYISGTPPNMKKDIFKREDTTMSNTTQSGMTQKQMRNRPHATRTPIGSFGWVMIILLLVLGAINFADKAVL